MSPNLTCIIRIRCLDSHGRWSCVVVPGPGGVPNGGSSTGLVNCGDGHLLAMQGAYIARESEFGPLPLADTAQKLVANAVDGGLADRVCAMSVNNDEHSAW